MGRKDRQLRIKYEDAMAIKKTARLALQSAMQTESVNEGKKLKGWQSTGTYQYGGGKKAIYFQYPNEKYYVLVSDDIYNEYIQGGQFKKSVEKELANSGQALSQAEFKKITGSSSGLSKYLSQGGRIWDHVESKKLPEGIELGKVFTGHGKSFKRA